MTIHNRNRRPAAGEASGARFLASVTSVDEARIALAGGADIVDAKDPSAGALGALPLDTIRAIRAALPGAALSATVGNPSPDTAATAAAVAATAATGVDLVKIGLARGVAARETIARVGALSLPPCRLVGVLIADRGIDIDELPRLAASGFAGVMLDTEDKSGRALVDMLSRQALEAFIAAAHAVDLFVGFAGALRLSHVAGLRSLGPDVLGFRGALCAGERRQAALDPDAIAHIRKAMSQPLQPADARAGAEPERAQAPMSPARRAATAAQVRARLARSLGERVP